MLQLQRTAAFFLFYFFVFLKLEFEKVDKQGHTFYFEGGITTLIGLPSKNLLRFSTAKSISLFLLSFDAHAI